MRLSRLGNRAKKKSKSVDRLQTWGLKKKNVCSKVACGWWRLKLYYSKLRAAGCRLRVARRISAGTGKLQTSCRIQHIRPESCRYS